MTLLRTAWASSVLVAVLAGGCWNLEHPDIQSETIDPVAPITPDDPAPIAATNNAPPTLPGDGNPTAGRGDAALTAGDKQTILLAMYEGPQHVQMADWQKKQADKYTGWKDVFVVHGDAHSAVYRGRYPSIRAAQRDLKDVRAYTTPIGKKIFTGAAIVPLPGQNAEGPPAWDLSRPQKGVYSVLVAVFMDLPEQNYVGRRQRAVQLCQKCRQKGLEAYYYHGPHKSGVSIGMFPPSAIRTKKVATTHRKTGDVTYRNIQEIVDPKLKAVLREHPQLLICGNTEIKTRVNPQTHKPEKYVQPTYPFLIPSAPRDKKTGELDRNAFRSRDTQPRQTPRNSRGTVWSR